MARAVSVGLVVLLTFLLPAAAAHEDFVVGEGTRKLPPGGSLLLEGKIHWHRLVGLIEASEPGARLVVVVMEPEGERILAGPGRDLQLNEMLPCCREVTYSPRTFVIRNVGTADATVNYNLVLLHDGIAVTNDRSERGALLFTVAVPLLAAIAFGRKLPRPLLGTHAEARRALRKAAITFGVTCGLAAALAGWGMLRYGDGPVTGTVAATADMPFTSNPILNTHAVLQLGLIALWIWSVALWVQAARRSPPGDRGAALLGLAIGCGAVVVCTAWLVDYDTRLAPLLTMAAAAPLPLLWGSWMLLRGERPVEAAQPTETAPPT